VEQFVPINDLGAGTYQLHSGGLYPGGKNVRPAPYEASGLALASSVRPRATDGTPADSGRIVLLAVGMSNTFEEFSQFSTMAEADDRTNPCLLFVNGARDGESALMAADPASDYWDHVEQTIQQQGSTAAQLQVAWVKTAMAREKLPFPQSARSLQCALRSIINILSTRFRRLALVYLSSRIYGGYSTTDLSPEPVAYESGFGVKWLIEERIHDALVGRSTPWLSWGPYLWAGGSTPRSDGLVWQRDDFAEDGVHPSPRGARKVAAQLLRFFQTDRTSAPWFLDRCRRFEESAKANVAVGPRERDQGLGQGATLRGRIIVRLSGDAATA
jgi:hypothetical protein